MAALIISENLIANGRFVNGGQEQLLSDSAIHFFIFDVVLVLTSRENA